MGRRATPAYRLSTTLDGAHFVPSVGRPRPPAPLRPATARYRPRRPGITQTNAT